MKTRKIIAILALLLCVALALTACGKDRPPEPDSGTDKAPVSAGDSETLEDKLTDEDGEKPVKPGTENPTEPQPETDAGSGTPAAAQPEAQKPADTVQEPETEWHEPAAPADFTFGDVEGREFYFSSGAGGWCTVLYIHEDGTFDGVYHDSDMGVTGEGYPNGTMYYCEFEGKFTSPEKVDGSTYKFNIESIEYAKDGGEEIIDGTKYIYMTAYGLDEAEDLYMYLPGSKIADLPEEYRSWVGYYYLEVVQETYLKFYGLYNENAGTGFSSYPDETDRKAAAMTTLRSTENYAHVLEDKIINDGSLSQGEMNVLSGDMYVAWDDCLNYMWGLLKKELSEAEMKKLTEEQLKWIADKEEAVKEAGTEFEGGTLYPLITNGTASDITKERVYELAEYFK